MTVPTCFSEPPVNLQGIYSNAKLKNKKHRRFLKHLFLQSVEQITLENCKYILVVFSEFWDLGFGGSLKYFGLYLQSHYVTSLKVQAILSVLKNTALYIGNVGR